MSRKKTSPSVFAAVPRAVLTGWLWASLVNTGVWSYVLSIVVRFTNPRTDLKTSGDIFAFGVTVAMTGMAIGVTLSIIHARSKAISEKEYF